jgi:protoheme ferro-lyase
MSHEHGGGEEAIKSIAEACEQEEIETANRRIAAFYKSERYLAYLAMQETDKITQEDREELLPPNYD